MTSAAPIDTHDRMHARAPDLASGRASGRGRVSALLARVGHVGLACALGLLWTASVSAQADGPAVDALLSEWSWRNIGPIRGGRSIAAAGSAARPLEYYFGATGGGLWKTSDAGTTWTPVTDGQIGSASVGAVGVCEADPDVLYIGTGEGQLRGTMGTGDGVYGSRDGGRIWSHLGLASSTGQQAVARVRVDPVDCDLVYAAVLGDPYGPNPERGLYRSPDGGRSWQRVLYRSDQAGVSDLSIDPHDPRTLFASVWDVRRRPWGGETGERSGIFRSRDGGDTWTELTNAPGLPTTRIGKVGISVSGADPARVYAVIEADPDYGGVFRSDDGGDTWTRTSGHHSLFVRAEYYTRIVADPSVRDRVYVLAPTFYRSDDGGRVWTQVRTPHGDNHDLWIDPSDSNRMIQANDGGANVSWNGGRAWTAQDFPTAQIYHVATTAHFPYHVCGAQQDNSTACVPSDGDGSYWYHAAGGEAGYVTTDPSNADVYYAGNYRGFITRYDRSTGQARNIEVWPDNPQGLPAAALRERFQWTFPIVLSPHDPGTLYVSSQHLWRTRNGGQSWQRISPDLTYADPETLRGSELIIRNQNSQDYYATIFAVAPSPLAEGVIWTGSDDGRIHVTRDDGTSWQDVTPPDLPRFGRVSMIEASSHSAGRAYAAVDRSKMQDVQPYLFRTDDFGRSWRRIETDIDVGYVLRAVREDPEREDLLFAGTEKGPLVSTDGGEHWQRIALGMPLTQISDLTVRDDDLVASSYGRSMWILDGVMPVLREVGPRVTASRFHLFRTSDAIRTAARQVDGDGRMINGRAVIPGANRVSFDYWLGGGVDRVAIEITSADGGAVTTLIGEAGEAPPRALVDSVGHVVNGPRWGFELAAPAPTGPGLHRVFWNLRHPQAPSFESMIVRGGGSARGPLVPPGEYTVRVTAGGESREQRFRVVRDPRSSDVTDHDLIAQYDLALRIHAALSSATTSMGTLLGVREQVGDRLGRTSDPRVQEEGADVDASLHEVQEAVAVVGARAQKGPLHFGGRLVNRIASLKDQVVESSDHRPTDQAYEAFDDLAGQLQVQLERLDLVLTRDLARLNELLRDAGLEPIEVPGRRVIS